MMPDLECMKAARERFANWDPVDRRIVVAEESRQQPAKRRGPKPMSVQASHSARERWKNAASLDNGICDKTGVKHRFKRAGYNSRTKAQKKQCMDCKRATVIRPGDLVSGIQY